MTGPSLTSFINQAVKLGETSKQVITINLNTGVIGSSTVRASTQRTTAFQAAHLAAWGTFISSLSATFGTGSLPPALEREIRAGKPLTARAIIQLTTETQKTARMAHIGALSSTLTGPSTSDRTFLLSQSPDILLDTFASLRNNPQFKQADPSQRQQILASTISASQTCLDDFVSDRNAIGLSDLGNGATFDANETSVEDRTKLRQDALRKGDPIGRITINNHIDTGSSRYLFVGLKDKGVEPGFLVTKNWLPSHDQALRGKLEEDNPIFQAGCNFLMQKIKETMLPAQSGLSDEEILDIAKEALRHFDNEDYSKSLPDLKLHIRSTLPEFTEKHVIKLDYNESDQTLLTKKLRLPERVKTSHGRFYRAWRKTTINESNRGALAESLANDITRVLGVPAQNLKLVRGSYRDGTPKLMVDSTYISGQGGMPYRDFDHFIRDGYLDKDLLKASGHSGTIRNLGKYKAAFLLLGDRDAVGSKGQNKGFVGNTFAAIDPGHSLEGSRVNIRDDFSFTYKVSPFTSGFKNFTVFDDAPLSEKMAGWDEIEAIVTNGGTEALFNQYLQQFGPVENDSKNSLNFSEDIRKMQTEFNERFGDMRETLAPRLAIYRGLKDDPLGYGPRLLNALENVEKLFSGTSPFSPSGKVRLEHLRVENRVAWDMIRSPEGNVTLTCRNPEQAIQQTAMLDEFVKHARKHGAPDFQMTMNNGTVQVTASQLDEFIAAFTESNVRTFKKQNEGI